MPKTAIIIDRFKFGWGGRVFKPGQKDKTQQERDKGPLPKINGHKIQFYCYYE